MTDTTKSTTKAPDHGHRFAVYSPNGGLRGLWADGKIAAYVASESPGSTIEELMTLDHSDALVAAAREEALREAASKCFLKSVEHWTDTTTIIPHEYTAEVIRRKILALIKAPKE